MLITDPFAAYKAIQKESWGLFAPLEAVTTGTAAQLVTFSQLKSGDTVLDVGCGTGVVAITAARKGAMVCGLDLCPSLLDRAGANASLARVNIDFTEGDVEALPYADRSFDVVLSQFGHIFAPRPEVAVREMLRVLKPGGRIAFSTWPPEFYVGKMFSLVSKYSPLPAGAASPSDWGNSMIIQQRLGNQVKDISFESGIMFFPALSFGHYRESVEKTLGPLLKLVQASDEDPLKLKRFRQELEELVTPYMVDNAVRQHYLMTRAIKPIP